MEAMQLDFGQEPKKPTTSALVRQIKEHGQDFQWYPTTDEILSVVKSDIDQMIEDLDLDQAPSLLDCGAGDGRSLMYLTKGDKYAIEKSKPLITAMDSSIFVIGADFHQQTLLDKDVELTFVNPPYDDYVAWATKIITESRSGFIYLVIPERWKHNADIQHAIELRDAESDVIGSFDFLNAERQARAKVDIVKVTLKYTYRYNRRTYAKTDPFDLWFNQHFKVDTSRKQSTDSVDRGISQEEVQNELVLGRDIISVLTELYARDLEKLISNYKAFETLDSEILDELGVSFEGVREGLKQKISGLKNLYWHELFDNLTKITDKLTKDSREKMLNKLTSRTDVDFNSDNVYAVVIWVIKNANHYYDQQLINLVEVMVEKANIKMYKSNQRTFRDDDWMYSRKPDSLDRFSLDHRVVLDRAGGLCVSDYSFERERYNGLSPRAYYLLLDILTIATNLGFDTTHRTSPKDFEWESNKGRDFYYYDHAEHKEGLLMTVKAFKKGTVHIKFNSKFIVKMNTEFGRLKGWLKSAQDASDEMGIDIEEAAQCFNSNLQLSSNNLVQLGLGSAA